MEMNFKNCAIKGEEVASLFFEIELKDSTVYFPVVPFTASNVIFTKRALIIEWQREQIAEDKWSNARSNFIALKDVANITVKTSGIKSLKEFHRVFEN